MPPSSNKSVGSASSNPKKQKNEKKKKADKKDKGKKEKTKAAADKQHHKERKPKEPKESRRSSTGKTSSKRHRRNSLRRIYWLVLVVVALVLLVLGMCYYKKSARGTQHATGAPAVPDTTPPSAHTEEGQQNHTLPRQRRQKLINLRPLIMHLVHAFERLLSSVIESPFFFPEARVTRLRSRALQEMRLNDEPLQDDPPYHSSPGYGPRPRRAVGKQLRTQREQHRAALQAIQPVMLNGQEQDCVSPRCLKDGSFPFFRWLENQQRRLVSPKSLCNFILHWGKGELELEASKATWMHGRGGGSEL